ncbi:hypothetical protein [Mycobacteroides chelonae]|nr:hypothetical protein [Mycobacteroides chelonae]
MKDLSRTVEGERPTHVPSLGTGAAGIRGLLDSEELAATVSGSAAGSGTSVTCAELGMLSAVRHAGGVRVIHPDFKYGNSRVVDVKVGGDGLLDVISVAGPIQLV